MAILTKKFSEFADVNLSDDSNMIVGYGAGGNFQGEKVISWSTATRPATPFNGLLGLNTDLNGYEFYSAISNAWIEISAGGSILDELASHDPGQGASLIGLEGTGTVQDLANNQFIIQIPNATTPNAQALSSLTTGILKSTTGTGIVSISAPLTSIDGLTTVANQMLYTTGADTYATTTLSAFARTLLDDPDAATAAVTLEVLPLDGGTMTGDINMGGFRATNASSPIAPNDYATKAYVDSGSFLPLIGGTMSGIINMGNNRITNLSDPLAPQDAVTQAYLNTQLGNYLSKSGGTMSGAINMGANYITSLLDPINPQDACTKAYADMIAAGLTVQPAVRLASTAPLTATYNNGASGISATLTNAGAMAALSLDGVAVNSLDRVLIKDQAVQFQNGIYIVLNQGSGAVNWELMRATDYDQPGEISPGDLVVVNEGATLAATSFIETAVVSAVGTDPILFSQFTFAPGAFLQAANNLSDVADMTDSFNNISPLTTKGDVIGYDGSDNVRLAVGASDGQILRVKTAATVGFDWSTSLWPDTTTVNEILYSSASNTVTGLATTAGGVLVTSNTGVPSMLANPGAAGRMLQSGNAAIAAWSTPTYPSASGATGKFIISDGVNNVYSTSTIPTSAGATANKVVLSDGTNYILSTPTFPNASASVGKFIRSDGTNWIASTPTLPTTAGASGKILQSDGTNYIESTPTYPSTSGAAGKIIISDGTNNIYSTPTYPNASVTSGKIIISNGTNYIASTPTFPNASASAGKFIRSDGTNWIESTPTLPTTAGSSGKVLYSNATNFVESTPTFPVTASATSRKIIVSDGTNWIASTETYAVPGASGNVMTSDGTNWTSAAPAGGGSFTNVVLASTFSTTSDTAVNVTNLKFTPAANTKYIIEGRFICQSTVTSRPGNIGVTWPTGYSDGCVLIMQMDSSATTSSSVGVGWQAAGSSGSTNSAGGNSNVSNICVLHAILTMGGSPSGDFQITLKRNSSTGSATVKVMTDSVLSYRTFT